MHRPLPWYSCQTRGCPRRPDKMLMIGHLQTSLHGSLLIAFLYKMLMIGHLQTSLHGSLLIAFLYKMLTLGHLQTSLHVSLLIAFLHKMLTLGHLQTSLHGSLLIAFFISFLSLSSYHIYAVLAEIYNGETLNSLNHGEKLYSGE